MPNINKNKKINTKYLQNLADTYKKTLNSGNAVDIISFAEAPWGLGFKLFPTQKFLLKCFYGLDLDDSEKTIIVPDELNMKEIGRFTELEFINFLIETGRTNIKKYIPGKKYRELFLCCGRRSSKSIMASIISNFEVYRLIKMGNPQEYFGFPSGQQIAVTTVATTDEQASTLFEMMKARSKSCAYLKDRIVNQTQTYFNLKTDEDELREASPSICLLCGGAGSNSLRGKNNLIVMFDEAAFFAKSGRNSGDEVYQALVPSIASFTRAGEKSDGEGKVIMLSSPYGKSGLFYQKYIESFDMTDSMLMFQMYSAMVNPTIDSSILRDAKRKNPALFDCEYGAKFSDTVTTWIDAEVLNKTIKHPEISYNKKQGKSEFEYFMGIDYGGKTDGSSISIVHKERDKIVLDYADVYYSGSSDVWDSYNQNYKKANKTFSGFEIIPIEGFADEILKLSELFPIKYGWFDQFNGYALLEMLKSKGMTQLVTKSVSAGLNTQVYQVCKTLINSELIELFNHEILIPELLSLEEIKNGAQLSVEAPQRSGYHDDISDSFARAVFACYEHSQKQPSNSYVSGFSRNGFISSHGSRSYESYHLRKIKMHGYNPKRGLDIYE